MHPEHPRAPAGATLIRSELPPPPPGVMPAHQTTESAHQFTFDNDSATARPSRNSETYRASGNAESSRGILRMLAMRLLTKTLPPPVCTTV